MQTFKSIVIAASVLCGVQGAAQHGTGFMEVLSPNLDSGDNALYPSTGTVVVSSNERYIRTAYLIEDNGLGVGIAIQDWDPLTGDFEGEAFMDLSTTQNWGRFKAPKLSKDGRAITFYAEYWDGSAFNYNHPYVAQLPNDSLEDTSTTTVLATPLEIDQVGAVGSTIGVSTMAEYPIDQRITAIDFEPTGSLITIAFEDQATGAMDTTPLLYAKVAGGVVVNVDFVEGSDTASDGFSQPALSDIVEWDPNPEVADDEILVYYMSYSDGGQIYRLRLETDMETPRGRDTVSIYSSNLGNGASGRSDISGAGTHVVFETTATNLRSSDTNIMKDIYWWSSSTGVILAYTNPGASGEDATIAERPCISQNAVWIGFESNNREFLKTTVDYTDMASSQASCAFRVVRGSPSTLHMISVESGTLNARDGSYTSVTNGVTTYNPTQYSGSISFHSGSDDIIPSFSRTGFDVFLNHRLP